MPSEHAFLRQRLALVEQELENPDREFIRVGKGRARREDATPPQVLAPALQRSAADASDILAGLTQTGLLQETQGLYRLTPRLYREVDLEPTLACPEDTMLSYVQVHGRITRREAMALCQINERQATYLL